MAEAEKAPNPMVVVRSQLAKMDGEFAAALPSHIPVERFTRVVLTAIQNNPDLLTVDRRSLFNSAMKAAQDGLLPDGRDGAIVPYKGEATWMPMIGGIRKKVRNSGEIATWDVQAVFENDEFAFELGDEPYIRHRPALTNRGKLVAVYSIATLKSGEKSRDVMSVEDVEKIRAKSRSQKGPWADPVFYPEMAKKTVARRHSKVLPMSTDLDDLIRRDDALYDLEGSSDKSVKADGPKGLAGRLSALAGGRSAPAALPSSSPDERIDLATGEILEGEKVPVEEDRRDDAPAAEQKKTAPAEQGKKTEPKREDPPPAVDDTFPGDRPAPTAGGAASTFIAEAERAAAAEDGGDDAREQKPTDIAYDAGFAAFKRGMSRRATPGELRAAGREAELDAYLRGYDDAAEEGKSNG